MVGVFIVLSLISGIWSAVKYQMVFNAVVGSFPLQFQDEDMSGYAFPVLVLSHTTPLSLQEEYVKALTGGCVMALCISLCFFSVQQWIVGCVCLGAFAATVFSTIKAWKTCKANRLRVEAADSRESS